MTETLEIGIRVVKRKLSPAASRALTHIERYSWVLFTSKNAVTFFVQELKRRQIVFPSTVAIAAVGPETARSLRKAQLRVNVVPKEFTVRDMVASMGNVKGQHILFPRSAIAPLDAVRTLRKKGGHVRTISLYTTTASPLTAVTKRAISAGHYTHVIFRSPSGIRGMLRQLDHSEKRAVKKIIAECIGPTTARAARLAGFKKVTIRSVL